MIHLLLVILAGAGFAGATHLTMEHMVRNGGDERYPALAALCVMFWPVYWSIVLASTPLTKMLPPPADNP